MFFRSTRARLSSPLHTSVNTRSISCFRMSSVSSTKLEDRGREKNQGSALYTCKRQSSGEILTTARLRPEPAQKMCSCWLASWRCLDCGRNWCMFTVVKENTRLKYPVTMSLHINDPLLSCFSSTGEKFSQDYFSNICDEDHKLFFALNINTSNNNKKKKAEEDQTR